MVLTAWNDILESCWGFPLSSPGLLPLISVHKPPQWTLLLSRLCHRNLRKKRYGQKEMNNVFLGVSRFQGRMWRPNPERQAFLPGQDDCPGRGLKGRPPSTFRSPVGCLEQGRVTQVAGGTGLKTNVHARLSHCQNGGGSLEWCSWHRGVSHLSNSLKDNFIPRDDYQLCPHRSYRCPDFRAEKIMCSSWHLSVGWKGKPLLTSQQTGRNLED